MVDVGDPDDDIIYRNRGNQVHPKVKLDVVDGYLARTRDFVPLVIDEGRAEIYYHVDQKEEVNYSRDDMVKRVLHLDRLK